MYPSIFMSNIQRREARLDGRSTVDRISRKERREMKVKVALYGLNGHQVHNLLVNHPKAELVATAKVNPSTLPEPLRGVKHYDTLEALLRDREVELISLCSPKRRDQAEDAIRCLKAGKNVYAEKPCATTEEDLDRIIETAGETGKEFHEMAGTAFTQPYLAMRKLVQAGTIGTVAQVLAQKSYPYHDRRPQDEDADGGLTMQAGIHAMRFIEHIAGVKISEIDAIETKLGNPVQNGDLRMAVSYIMRLENGGVASAIANYFNPKGLGVWGNDQLRIFGTLGFVEAVDGATRTRLIVGEKDYGEINTSEPSRDYFDMYVEALLGEGEMPFSLEDELHPTRMVIRAKLSANRRGL